jgi:hypothetical protein
MAGISQTPVYHRYEPSDGLFFNVADILIFPASFWYMRRL